MKTSKNLKRHKVKKVILIHLIVWILLSVIYFFLSETIVKLIFPTIHGVELWLMTVYAGVILISILVVISLIINLAWIVIKRRYVSHKDKREDIDNK